MRAPDDEVLHLCAEQLFNKPLSALAVLTGPD